MEAKIIRKNVSRIIILFVTLIFAVNVGVYGTDKYGTDQTSYNYDNAETRTINDIIEDWKGLEDEELNEIIGNSDDVDVARFLVRLSEQDLAEILKRETMLLNPITFYKPVEGSKDDVYTEQEIESHKIYWEYLMSLANQPSPMSVIATSKTGYFYIVIEGDGVTTKRKVQVTITNTNLAYQQTAKFSEVAVSGYSDKHNFTIKTASNKTQLGSSSGSNKYYEIAVLKFTYLKPAHYQTKGSYSGKCEGNRMNFQPYSLNNTLETTVNNTGHNEKDTTETIDLQINFRNCGILTDSSGKTYHATGKLTLSLYNGGLIVNPNGGTWNNSTSKSTFTAKCTITKSIANPTRTGYVFTGWTVTNGSNADGNINRNKTGSAINSSGCTFTYCGSSSSAPSSGSTSYYTTLTANWKKIDDTLPDAGGIPLDAIFIIVGISFIKLFIHKF